MCVQADLRVALPWSLELGNPPPQASLGETPSLQKVLVVQIAAGIPASNLSLQDYWED